MIHREHAPHPSQMGTYFTILNERLANVPELQPGLDLAESNPELAASIYIEYTALIATMSALSDTQRQIIHDAKAKMIRANGNFGTASKVSADNLLDEIGSDKVTLTRIAESAANPSSPYFIPALDELTKRMEGGHQLKLSGKRPSDDDPESRTVIWGHTMITDPEALVHFTCCHYLERYFAIALVDQGSQLAQQKDFMLNALIDVVLVDHVTDNKFGTIYERWRAPKDAGGLGWITDDRLESYQTVPSSE